jgi:serine/threonine protein kinase/tetratricopeptide (TPR) repeat protein
MNRERWKTANQVFHAALEVPASDRHAFVVTASRGDSDLQSEVELLLQADLDAGSYLESPAVPPEGFSFSSPELSPASIKPGDVLCGRFRILGAVGEGGMGHVFEAFDAELAVHVALKVIRPEISSSPEALTRFRQEVRLARQITHSNVCRTFEIEREERTVDSSRGLVQEVVFFTMEFLEGETLASRVKRDGPLDLTDSLDLARQVADALGAAHSLGIIHRDMKPANIILVPAESTSNSGFRAVITDFGLARLDSALPKGDLSAFSFTSRPMGTLAYMAPEQFEAGSVSPATDIYAFGLILFEVITGRRAFPTENFLSGIALRLSGPSPSPKALVPNLPTPWCHAIEGCLRLRPGDRFQSAADVISVLDGSRTTLPRLARRPLIERLTFASRLPWRRSIALVAVFLAAVALLFGYLRLHKLETHSQVDRGALVYLPQVRNETGEKAFDNLTALVQAGLTQSGQVNLVDTNRAGDILEQMTKAPDSVIDQPTAREIAMRAGAVRVVFVTVSGSGGMYSLKVDIQKPGSTPASYREHWPNSFSWRTSGKSLSGTNIPPELLATVRNANDWIRSEVGESANDIARLDVPPEDVTTANWTALANYTYGDKLGSQEKREEAAVAFQSAIQNDPGFALAYARLGDILVNLNRVDEGYRAYLKALEESDRSRLSLRERDRIKGIYAQDTGDFKASEEAFREYSLYYEHDYLGWFYRARPLSMLGRTSEAIEVLKRAHEADGAKSGAVVSLVRQCLLADDVPQAKRWAAELGSMRDDEAALLANGTIDFAEGDYPKAVGAFQALEHSPKPLYRSDGIRSLADFEAEQGDYRKARELLDRAVEENPQDASQLLDRAYVNGNMGEYGSAAEDIKLAISKDRSPYTLLAASEVLGQILPRAGSKETQQLKAILNSLEHELPPEGFGTVTQDARLRIQGEVLLARGDAKDALSAFRKADKLEAPIGSRDYLGRALMAQAAAERDRAKATLLRERAMEAFATIAMRPAVVWQFPIAYPPGFYADELGSWLRAATWVKNLDSLRTGAMRKLEALRPHAAAVPA